jgi:transcriptional regulator with XRE-family HTH domain
LEGLQEKLKELRRRRGLTQEELAREIGVSLRTLARWETTGGKPFRILRTRLKQLFEAAGIHVG